ncbi:MAG: hypothetical protein A3G34_08690 [Candidatus Lindowbacteria bacterium RIFCSPLOWO2_12_FULL_62_27]|nr:MAG: hypothetical protein A3G34_08690 [Candidatus Lindowbacteria bacterium RIFCSPLOWO2_12_FULL_62_27]
MSTISPDDARDLLKVLIMNLPKRHRQIIYLIDYEKLTHADVADVLNLDDGHKPLMSAQRVERIYDRIRVRLQRRMENEGYYGFL